MLKILKIWKQNSIKFQEISNKGRFKQLFEIIRYRFHGFYPSSYYTIPLFSEFGKRPLISEADYIKFEKYLNPRKQGVVPFNKWVQSCFWKANGLPHANTLGFINKQTGILNGKTINTCRSELESFFMEANFPLVIKPIDGQNGIGFDVIDKYDNQKKYLVSRSKGKISIKSLLSSLFDQVEKNNGYIFQEYIMQHPSLVEFYPNAVNSLRVVTHMDKNQNFSVDCALMKFGAGHSITDNNNVDGRVFAIMDVNNGTLKKAFTGSFSQDELEFHPDSKQKIYQFMIPFWKECLDLALSAHRHLPFPRHLGWDIAISEDGPLIIELNSFLAISVYQKGRNDLMGTTAFGKSYTHWAGLN